MTLSSSNTQNNRYAQWFTRFMFLGIAANLAFVVPLMCFPEALLGFLKMTVPQPVIWCRASGLLLLEISILYIPLAREPFRYASIAWLAIPVMRGGGASFFLIAVLLFGQELGFITIALVDSFFLTVQLFLLHRAQKSAPEMALRFAAAA